MSPIGRVFIVINLVLAATFVGFAGTYLQRQANFKSLYEQSQAELQTATESSQREVAAAQDQMRQGDRELRAHKQQLDAATTENSSLTEKNQQLESQLADLASDIKSLTSQTGTMDQAIQQSVATAKQAYDDALEAIQAREAALNEKQVAEEALSVAQASVSDLETQLADANGRISALEQENAENALAMSVIAKRAPGVLAQVQPEIRGVVEAVQPGGQLLTVRITDAPEALDIKSGYRFAIFKDEYKGEAVIQDVEGSFAFCRMTTTRPGQFPQVGDDAATNVGT
ncbi:MAG: hypothetical protein AAF628_37300 [Planctomycetota bacterium]